jgi:glycosyltransferase involved in cell wall biosynthesis
MRPASPRLTRHVRRSKRREVAGLAVLIPAFQCEETVAAVVTGARRYVADVVVVDDGSSDRTATRAREAGAEVLRHERNLGKGAALLAGMRRLAERGFARALTMDADGQHLSEQIPILLQVSSGDPQALVIGARRIEPGTVAPLKLFGNRFADRWVAIASGQNIRDTQSGFRVYPLPATLALGARAGHFAFETEILIRAARARVPIRSVAVEVYYPPARQRVSHFRPFLDTVRIIYVVVGLMLRLR